MHPVTALAFMLLGLSLWLTVRPPLSWHPVVSRACSATVVLIGLLKLCETSFGWDIGIDRFAFDHGLDNAATGQPTGMAPTTALNFMMMGTGLTLCVPARTHRLHVLAQSFLIAATAIALLSAMGYLYDISSLQRIGFSVAMAPLTALMFLVVAIGICFAQPD